VLAAHDEAALIAGSIGALATLGRPVYLIADHCADDTAAVAAAAGARVYVRQEGEGGKGAALAWFMEVAEAELRDLDALIVLDADSRLAPGFVEAMARAFAQGAEAAQGFVQPVGVTGSPVSALAAYSELLSQRIGDKIRSALGWTVPLRGTGMAFRPHLLREVVKGLRTRTEDIELSLRLAGRGVRVWWVPEAVMFDPKPQGLPRAANQRARWLQGQAQVWRHYGRDILRLLLTGGPNAWSLLWALLLKPKTLVTLLKVGLLALMTLLPIRPPALRGALLCLTGAAVAVDVAYYLVGLLLVRERGLYARALLAAPLYIAMWLWSLLLAPLARRTWLRARD
jgi:cellulose synthase/poly-beta-1,6-N-acetylglucosamine synthase-like glycosyltransferase